MKLSAKLITLLLLVCIHSLLFAQTSSESRSAHGYVTTNQVTKTITLHWNTTANTTAFRIYRRALNSTNWGTALATLDATTISYTDTDITTGNIYEYAIERETNTNDPFRSGNILGYSYISAGIETPAKHQRGTLWIFTTTLINDSLPNEISTLVADLVADGWDVHQEVIDTNTTVVDMKLLIKISKALLDVTLFIYSDIYQYPTLVYIAKTMNISFRQMDITRPTQTLTVGRGLQMYFTEIWRAPGQTTTLLR